jgi:hypothetical protein
MKMDYRLDPPDEIEEDDDGFDPDRKNDEREDREYDRVEFYHLDDGNKGD